MEIPYLLRAAITMTAMYIAYKAFMSRDASHAVNRAAILASAAAPMTIPLLNIPSIMHSGADAGEGMQIGGMQIGGIPAMTGDAASSAPSLAGCWQYIIAAGAAFFLIRMAISMAAIISKAAENKKISLDGGAVLVLEDSMKSPVSWLWYIFMSRSDYSSNSSEIMAHEMAHIRLWHSIDLIIMDLICSAQWFSPAAWLLRRELRAVHEYQADKAVLDSGFSAKEYQILLIRKAAGRNWNSVASSLNHSNLKKRITMMRNQKKTAISAIKSLLPLAAGALCAITIAGSASASPLQGSENIREAIVRDINAADYDRSPEIHQQSDTTLPEYPGGEMALRKHIAENIRYPESAKEARISGTVYVRVLIGKTGKPGKLEILKSSGNQDLDNEALRCLGTLADFKPATCNGNPVEISVALPIKFQ